MYSYNVIFFSLHCPSLPYRILWSSKWKIPKIWTAYLIFHGGWKIFKHNKDDPRKNDLKYIANWPLWRIHHRKNHRQSQSRISQASKFKINHGHKFLTTLIPVNKNLQFYFHIFRLVCICLCSCSVHIVY